MFFQGYLIWYHKTHPRAQRLNTYETGRKALRQSFYDVCHKVVADDVGKEITSVRRFRGFKDLQCYLRVAGLSDSTFGNHIPEGQESQDDGIDWDDIMPVHG